MQPSSLPGSQARQCLSPGLTSTHCPWTPSAHSESSAHAESAAHTPLEPQSGPVASGDPAHSASALQPRHTFASHTGVAAGQPPVALQSTHLFVAVLHLSFVPLQPPSSMQSTQVAVSGSHWPELPQPVPVPDGSQSAHRPFSAPFCEQAGVLLDFARQRASGVAAASQATHWPASHSGAAALAQSPSLRHSLHDPGDPTQNFSVPLPLHAAPPPQAQPRFVQPLANVELHAAPHAAHCDALVGTQAGVPEVPSQQSSLFEQPMESAGSHAAQAPFWAPVVAHAPNGPPGFATQRSFATDAMDAVSHPTHALPTQRGFFGSLLQSASSAHSTQCPEDVSQTGVPARFSQCASAVHAWHAKSPVVVCLQSGFAASVQPASEVGSQALQRWPSTQYGSPSSDWQIAFPEHALHSVDLGSQIGVVGVTQSVELSQPPHAPLDVHVSVPGQSFLPVEHFLHVFVVESQIGVVPLQPALFFGSQAAHLPSTHSDSPVTSAQSVTSRHCTQRDSPPVTAQWSSVSLPEHARPELASH